MFKKQPENRINLALVKLLTLPRLTKKHNNFWEQGYTLIELLVAMIIAVLVISPLLGLAVNLLQTDRQEQAKATSEEELQLAADFIVRDLKQAVYIYDADALEDTNTNDGTTSGIQNQIPPGSGALGNQCVDVNTCQPILVFWKRNPFENVLPKGVPNCTGNNAASCDDTFAFSLVAYYLIKNNNANNVWSNTARIARFEISDGVLDPNSNNGSFLVNPSDGFAMFDLSLGGSDLAGKMNRWVRDDGSYSGTTNYSANNMHVLVDYIDQTPANQPNPDQPPQYPNCPQDTYQDINGNQAQSWSRTPPNPPVDFPNSFYACVNHRDTAAIIYLRGNAIARIQNETNPPKYTQNRRNAGYFPSIKTEVQSVGRLVQ